MALLWITSFAQALEDPTRPEAYVEPLGDEVETNIANLARLQSILNGKERRVALINGQVVEEGDDLDGILIVAINENSVRIRWGNGQFEQDLKLTSIEKEFR